MLAGAAEGAIGAANALRGGGSYRAVRSANTGGEVHHMPAWGSLKQMGDKNPFSHGSAPGILMEKGDHMLTASWGPQGAAYRAESAAMLQEGRFLDALARDIADVQGQFPGKYDAQVADMLAYLWGGR